jgi:DNA-binding SARP family transcriptional activator
VEQEERGPAGNNCPANEAALIPTTMTQPHHPTPSLRIYLFGAFEVRLSGTPMPRLRSRKHAAILALLTLRHGRPVDRTWLAGLLWPENAERQGLATLRRYLTDLRRALGPEAPRLHAPTASSLALDLEGVGVDVLAFDAAVAGGDPPSLAAAVALYRGPLLKDWTEEWVFEERQVRAQACLSALETLAAAARDRGELAAA